MILLVSFDIYYFLIGHFDYGTQTKNYGEETKTPAFRTSNYIFRKLEKTYGIFFILTFTIALVAAFFRPSEALTSRVNFEPSLPANEVATLT